MVTDALAGATGPEVFGGPRDGSLDAFMVVAQVEVVPAESAAGGLREGVEVLHLGFTREAALDVARKLVKAAGLLPQV